MYDTKSIDSILFYILKLAKTSWETKVKPIFYLDQSVWPTISFKMKHSTFEERILTMNVYERLNTTHVKHCNLNLTNFQDHNLEYAYDHHEKFASTSVR